MQGVIHGICISRGGCKWIRYTVIVRQVLHMQRKGTLMASLVRVMMVRGRGSIGESGVFVWVIDVVRFEWRPFVGQRSGS